jgi:hypothetical protein
VFASGVGETATMDISGGTLRWLNGDFYQYSGNGTLHLSGSGYLYCPRYLELGSNEGGYINQCGTHTWTIDGGKLDAASGWGSHIGNTNGSVTVVQNGGFAAWSGSLRLRQTGLYVLSNGVSYFGHLEQAGGEYRQVGGVTTNYYSLHVGRSVTPGPALLNWQGGTMRLQRNIWLADLGGTGTVIQGAGRYAGFEGGSGDWLCWIGGATGKGTWYMGDATGPATNYFPGLNVGLTGTLRGHGKIYTFPGSWGPQYRVYMSGKVVADGYGTDRTLDMSSGVAPITNVTDNASDKGWYAVNRGKLTLPTTNVNANGNTYNWGEGENDPDVDLVNSAQIVFSAKTGSGTLSGSLLATDRTDVPAAPGNATFASIHEFTVTGISAYTYTLTIRYDHVAVTAGNEPIVCLYRYNGSSWDNVTASRDTANRRVTSTPQSSFSLFAVGYPNQPGTVMQVR